MNPDPVYGNAEMIVLHFFPVHGGTHAHVVGAQRAGRNGCLLVFSSVSSIVWRETHDGLLSSLSGTLLACCYMM